MNITQHRAREARIVTTLTTLICTIGFLSAVLPAVEDAITAGLLTLAGIAALVAGLRFALRRARHRREDRADARTAARWRAAHAPHLLQTSTGPVPTGPAAQAAA